MAGEITKLDSGKQPSAQTVKLGQGQNAGNAQYFIPDVNPGESFDDYQMRVLRQAQSLPKEQYRDFLFNHPRWNEETTAKFGQGPDVKGDADRFSARLPGLVAGAQSMGPQNANTYGADPSIYTAINNRANQKFNQNISDLNTKLKMDDFSYRQQGFARATQQDEALRQYEHVKKGLEDQQQKIRKAKRGQVVGNILGIVGGVVGGIFGGAGGAQAGYSAGQGIGNVAGSS